MTDGPTHIAGPLGKTVDEIIAANANNPAPPQIPTDDIVERMDDLRRHRESLWEQKIPPRFLDAKLGDFDCAADTNVDDVVTAIDAWVDDGARSNLVILGPVGTGKTHAAIGAARALHFTGKRIAFWPVVELLDALRPGASELGARDPATARESAILILDDLGAERPTDWTAERLYALVNRRWLEELPIIVTSNLEPEDLRAAVGDRLYSRLAHDAVAVRFSGGDRRRS